MTPGCRNVRSFRAAFLAKGRRALLELTSKVKRQHGVLSSCHQTLNENHVCERRMCTFLTPLCTVQMDSPASILSPIVTGKELDFAMADATADLRKSMNSRPREHDPQSAWNRRVCSRCSPRPGPLIRGPGTMTCGVKRTCSRQTFSRPSPPLRPYCILMY